MTTHPAFPHPTTGQALETLTDFQNALTAIEEEIAPLYRVRRKIHEAMTDRYEAVLPEARYRTLTQEKVARCPRCRNELELAEAADFYAGKKFDRDNGPTDDELT